MGSKGIKRIIFILFLGLAVISCAKKGGRGPAEDADPIERAQAQIDQGQYSEAIRDLEAILRVEPSNDRARVTLASVYVHRAGIRIKQYFNVEKIFRNGLEDKSSRVHLSLFDRIKIGTQNELKKVYDFLKGLNEVEARSADISVKLEQIPNLDQAQAEDIHVALLILTELRTPNAGMMLYRGTIKAVYFKYLWSTDRFFSIGEKRLCSQRLGQLSEKLTLLRDYTKRMIFDLAMGYPKAQLSLLKASQEFEKNVNQAQAFIINLGKESDRVDQTLKKVLKANSVEGFQCDF